MAVSGRKSHLELAGVSGVTQLPLDDTRRVVSAAQNLALLAPGSRLKSHDAFDECRTFDGEKSRLALGFELETHAMRFVCVPGVRGRDRDVKS